MGRRYLSYEQEKLVEDNIGLAYHLLYRFRRHRNDQYDSDYESAALFGLMKAARAFNPEIGKFSTFAGKVIWNELQFCGRKLSRATSRQVYSEDVLEVKDMGFHDDNAPVFEFPILENHLEQIEHDETAVTVFRSIIGLREVPRKIALLFVIACIEGNHLKHREIRARVGCSQSYVSKTLIRLKDRVAWQQKYGRIPRQINEAEGKVIKAMLELGQTEAYIAKRLGRKKKDIKQWVEECLYEAVR